LRFFQNLFRTFFDFIFPPECFSCQKENFWICPQCVKKIEINYQKTHINGFKKVFILTNYRNKLVAKLVKKLKFKFCHRILDDLEPFFEKYFSLLKITIPKKAILCPVPLNFWRKNFRGFNQANLIAQKISKIFGNEIKKILIRKKNTIPQSSLKNPHDRYQNVVDAFKISKKKSKNINTNTEIFLIDDVGTTFSTINECRKTLMKNGFNHVSVILLAKSF